MPGRIGLARKNRGNAACALSAECTDEHTRVDVVFVEPVDLHLTGRIKKHYDFFQSARALFLFEHAEQIFFLRYQRHGTLPAVARGISVIVIAFLVGVRMHIVHVHIFMLAALSGKHNDCRVVVIVRPRGFDVVRIHGNGIFGIKSATVCIYSPNAFFAARRARIFEDIIKFFVHGKSVVFHCVEQRRIVSRIGSAARGYSGEQRIDRGMSEQGYAVGLRKRKRGFAVHLVVFKQSRAFLHLVHVLFPRGLDKLFLICLIQFTEFAFEIFGIDFAAFAVVRIVRISGIDYTAGRYVESVVYDSGIIHRYHGRAYQYDKQKRNRRRQPQPQFTFKHFSS